MTRSAALSIREATDAELARWDDLVAGFPGCRIVHKCAWIRSLEAAGLGRPLHLVYEREGEIVGCLPGLLADVGPFRLFGSPMAGWQSVSMGPVFDAMRVTAREMTDALVPLLESRYNVDHIEIISCTLGEDAMLALGFRAEQMVTFRAPLTPTDPKRTFRAMKESARRNVKRATQLGLTVRLGVHSKFIDEHYAQIAAVFARGGNVVPFGRDRLTSFVRHMEESGNLIAASAYLPDGVTCIATATFTVDGSELLLWMWAHDVRYRWYRPTELMTWTIMQAAMERGCTTLDFMGRGDFKAVFGAHPEDEKQRWVRSRRPWITRARDLAGMGYRWQQAVRGRVARWRLDDRAVTPPQAAASAAAGRGSPAGTQPATAAAPVAPRGVGGLPSWALAHRTGSLGGSMTRRVLACVMGDMDLVRPIGMAGIPCAVVARRGAAPRYSRFATARVEWLDAWNEPEALVDVLVRFGAAQSDRPVLFYEEDRELLLISRFREVLAPAFRFVVPDATLVEDLVNKDRFRTLAMRIGLPTPGARLLRASDDVDESLDLRFPLIVKPLTRRTDRWEPIAGARKAIEVDSISALRALRHQLAGSHVDVLAQEMIPGPESAIESYHVYVDSGGEIVGEFTGRKIRTYPAQYGHSTALETTDAPDVTLLGRALVARLGLRGVAKFDFKRSPDGELYLLEVNPRFNLWHHLGAVAGVNLPALVYGDLVGDRRPVSVAARPGVRWCKPWSDLSAARQHGVPLQRWLPWMMRCEAKRLVAWDDPLPFVLGSLFHVISPAPGASPVAKRPARTPGADVPYAESSRSPA